MDHYIISNEVGVKMLLDHPMNLSAKKISKAGTILIENQAFDVIYDPNYLPDELFVAAGKKAYKLKIVD